MTSSCCERTSLDAAARGGISIAHDELRRGGRPVLAAGVVQVPAGAAVALVGANGAGKSTLLMALAGVLAARGGEARIDWGGGARRSIGYVPQRPAFPDWLRVREVLRLYGADDASGHECAEELGLGPLLGRPASALSGGQTQLLAMAIALARNDPLVLLDEPFSGVDIARRRVLLRLVARSRDRRPAPVMILSSHVAGDLYALCDWVVALRDGGYAYQGSRDTLLAGAPGAAPLEPAAAAARFEERLAALT